MSKFNSAEYTKPEGNYTPKVLNPGEHYCRVVALGLEPVPWNAEHFQLTFTLETPAMGDDFEGVDIDKTKPELGKYQGQIAWVKAGTFPFSTYTWKDVTYDRDEQIFKWVNNFASQLGVFEAIQKANVGGDTIGSYIENIKPFLINPELYAYFNVNGREWWKPGQSRPNYNLFFPKYDNGSYGYSALLDGEEKPLKFIKYNEHLHIVKVTPPAPIENNVDDFNKGDVVFDSNKDSAIDESTPVDQLPF